MKNCRRLVPLLLAILVVLIAGMKELASSADPMAELSTLILDLYRQVPSHFGPLHREPRAPGLPLRTMSWAARMKSR